MQLETKHIIITRQFIHLNFPKAGGTWTERALEAVIWSRFRQRSAIGRLMSMLIWLNPRTEVKLIKRCKSLIHHNLTYLAIAHNLSEMSFDNYKKIYQFNIKKLIKQLIQTLLDRCFLINEKRDGAILIADQHLSYSELSDEFKQIPVLANIRDPFTWHTSRYAYYENTQKFLATYSNLSPNNFSDYLENTALEEQNIIYQGYSQHLKDPQHKLLDIRGLCPKDKKDHIPQVKHFGLMTMIFIYHVLKDPAEVLFLSPKEFEEYWESGAYKTNIPSNIIWLQQANLRQDLYKALKKFDYRDSELENIHTMDKILVSQPNPKPLNHYYKDLKQLELIYKLEKPLFILFPEYEKLYRETLTLYPPPPPKNK